VRAGVFLLLLLGGCGSCKDKAKAYLSEPPIEDYRAEVESQAPTAAKQATSMCGFPVEGLADAKVTIAEQSPRRFRVEGKPITKGDAGIDKSKALLCIGIVSLVAWPIVEGDKVTSYKWDPIAVERVETPGVSYTKPSSGGGWD
jgi:hypothetical protein